MINEIKESIINFWEKKRYLSVFIICAAFLLFLVATAPNSDLFLEPYDLTAVTPAPTEPAPVVPEPTTPAPVTPEPTPAPVITTPEPQPVVAVANNSRYYVDGKGGRTVAAVSTKNVENPSFTINAARIDDRSVYGYFAVEISYSRAAGFEGTLPQPQFTLQPNDGSCQLSNLGNDQYVVSCDIANAQANYSLTVSANGQSKTLSISWQ